MQSNDIPSLRSLFVGVLMLVGLVVGVVWIAGDAGSGAAGQSTARPGRLAYGARSSPAATAPRVTPTPHATSTPRPTATPVKPLSGAGEPGKLDIIDLSYKDAGTGDGSFYEYVDLANNTETFYSFVSLDGTCRDANDRVVATGIGNVANLASGERTTVTMIFLNAEGCDTVSVLIADTYTS